MQNINKNNKLVKNKQNNEIFKHIMNDYKWFIQYDLYIPNIMALLKNI